MAAKTSGTPSRLKERAQKRVLVTSDNRRDWLKPLVVALLARAHEDALQIRTGRCLEKEPASYQRDEALRRCAGSWHINSTMPATNWKPMILRDDFLDWLWSPQFALIAELVEYDPEYMRQRLETSLGVTRTQPKEAPGE